MPEELATGESPPVLPTTKKELLIERASSHVSMYRDLSHLAIAAQEAADWYREWPIEN